MELGRWRLGTPADGVIVATRNTSDSRPLRIAQAADIIRRDGHTPEDLTLRLEPSAGSAGANVELSEGSFERIEVAVPAGGNNDLVLTADEGVAGNHAIWLVPQSQTQGVTVRVPGWPAEQGLAIHVNGLGVTVDGPTGPRADPVRVVVHSGGFSGSGAVLFELVGDCEAMRNDVRLPPIVARENLTVRARGTSNWEALEVDCDELILQGSVPGDPHVRFVVGRVVCAVGHRVLRLDGVTLTAETDADNEHPLIISPGTAQTATWRVPEGGTVSGLRLIGCELHLLKRSVAIDISGRGIVTMHEGATLSGAAAGGESTLALESVTPASGTDSEGFTVIDVEIQPTASNLPLLSALESAHRIELLPPDLSRIGEISTTEALRIGAFYERLIGIADRKHASGDSLAAMSYALYEYRRHGTRDQLERWALRITKLVGHGQRPGMALAAHATMALLFTGLHQGATRSLALEFSLSAIGSWLLSLLLTFFAPVGLVRVIPGWSPGMAPWSALYALGLGISSVTFAVLVFAIRRRVRLRL